MKYRINEAIEIKVKKQCNNYPSHNQLAKTVKGEEGTRVFKSRGKGCEMTLDKKIGFERLDRGEIVRVQNGNKL